MASERESPRATSVNRILVNSRHFCVVLAIAQIDNRPAHEHAVEVDRELNASIVVRKTGLQVHFHRKIGSVDGFNECRRTFLVTADDVCLLKLSESSPVDCDRHHGRREAGGAHGCNISSRQISTLLRWSGEEEREVERSNLNLIPAIS